MMGRNSEPDILVPTIDC